MAGLFGGPGAAGTDLTPPDRPVTDRVPADHDSGPGPVAAPPRGGLSPFGGKALERHVAELERLAERLPLACIVERSRAAVAAPLHHARLEVELNVWCSSAAHGRMH